MSEVEQKGGGSHWVLVVGARVVPSQDGAVGEAEQEQEMGTAEDVRGEGSVLGERGRGVTVEEGGGSGR